MKHTILLLALLPACATQVDADASCREADDCRVKGLCAFDGTRCAPTVDGCRDSTDCLRTGACAPVQWGGAWMCGATEGADCTQSYECATKGACSWQYPYCF